MSVDVAGGSALHTHLNPDDFPGSPYARELRDGGPGLRFPPELEREFVPHRLEQVRWRVRAFALATFLLGLAYALEKYLRAASTESVLFHLALALPVIGALLWLAFSRRFTRLYARASWLLAPLLGALAVVLSVESMALGAPETLAVAALTMVAAFVFMGLMFRTAALTGAVVLLAFVLAGFAYALPADTFARGALLLVVAGVLSALICRDIELHQRRRFLVEALVGDLVERDGLTGLKNRRALDDHLRRVWQLCLRDGRSLGLLFIDLDSFKAYNDAHGHQAGDAVLQRVARTVRGFAQRPLDLAARYGGEELCVLLHDVEPAHVAQTAERLRGAVEALGIEHAHSGCADRITVSVGAAIVLPAADRSPEGLVQLADEALYLAKAAGRNRCEVVGEPEYATLVTGQFVDVRMQRRDCRG